MADPLRAGVPDMRGDPDEISYHLSKIQST